MKKMIALAFVISLALSSATAQEPLRFWNEVQALKNQDSLHFPAAGQILFIGSSSFTKWTDVQEYFPSYKILNRAFGGSTLLDLITYRYEILYPYQPKQILIYLIRRGRSTWIK